MNWPDCVAFCVLVVGFVSLWRGWPRLIYINVVRANGAGAHIGDKLDTDEED